MIERALYGIKIYGSAQRENLAETLKSLWYNHMRQMVMSGQSGN